MASVISPQYHIPMHLRQLMLVVALFLGGNVFGQDFSTPFEKGNGNTSARYDEAINYYEQLAETYPQARLLTMGLTDHGKPLHLLLLSADGTFDPAAIKARGKAFVLINNGIHPGEPCGIDACMMLARDLIQEERLPEDVVIGIIPVYNIGGAHNRGAYSRANQNGPEMHGFRGNARNYDLNRDFVKMDSRNARSFAQIFQTYLPDVFVDTHTTNGADYQAVLTLIETQHNKLMPSASEFMTEQLTPALYDHMEQAEVIMSPYVNVFGRTPDDGFAGFLDLPRYSTGYAALFQTPCYVTEAHMFKPFSDRVEATYTFLEGMIGFVEEKGEALVEAVQAAREEAANASVVDLAWELDTTEVEAIEFAGYEAQFVTSELTGQTRLRYDRSQSWTREVPFLNTYRATLQKEKPSAYLIPQGYIEVIERLEVNGVELARLQRDTTLRVEVSYLNDVENLPYPYEGHYYHQGLTAELDTQELKFYAGDVVAFTGQWRDPYLVHVLEPQAQDAFFRWNFFDAILMQKEYFSSYVFEETALDLLAADPELKATFEARKAEDEAFAQNARAQLDFIYKHSSYYEPTHRRYPVVRWEGERTALDVVED